MERFEEVILRIVPIFIVLILAWVIIWMGYIVFFNKPKYHKWYGYIDYDQRTVHYIPSLKIKIEPKPDLSFLKINQIRDL
uniref:Uncharacterized protein n=1 Tax=viral metagenome TaxID=1070528 RepID=A0A6M3L9V5_9ZZZZ